MTAKRKGESIIMTMFYNAIIPSRLVLTQRNILSSLGCYYLLLETLKYKQYSCDMFGFNAPSKIFWTYNNLASMNIYLKICILTFKSSALYSLRQQTKYIVCDVSVLKSLNS